MLRQSKAFGVLVQPHYRGADLLAVVESTVPPDLPGLRDVVDLSRWDEFLDQARDDGLPAVAWRHRPDPVHVRDDRLPQGRDAPAPGPGGGEPDVRRGQRGRPGYERVAKELTWTQMLRDGQAR